MNDAATAKRYLPWVVATVLFMEQLDSTIVNTAIPSMAASLQVAPLSLKAVVASYILSLAVFIPVSGWMADRYGTRRIFLSAVSIFTVASILCGLSVNPPMLVAARLLQGVGAAMMMPVGRLTIVRTFPKSELLAAMNFVVIPALIGPLLGPTVGPSSGPISAGITTKFIAASSSDLGNVRMMVRRPTGIIIAAPAPCSRRAATSIGGFSDTPHRMDASVNTDTALKNTWRVPKRSAIQPLIGMQTARLRM